MLATRGQTKAILEHLQKFGHITSMEAFEKYGATRLAAIIFVLRREYVIVTEDVVRKNRFGEVRTFGNYIYKGLKEE